MKPSRELRIGNFRPVIRNGGLAIALVLLLAGLALAQGGYDLSWWTVDDGGETLSTGVGYSLGGTIGQPDAGTLSGPGYRLTGGFWQSGWEGGGVIHYDIYLPLVVRGAGG